jgi:hypothetical protein
MRRHSGWIFSLTKIVVPERLQDLISEANQLVAIFAASRQTAKRGAESTINNQKSTIQEKKAS